MTGLIKVAAVLIAFTLTGSYLFVLYGLTWFYCFGESAGCAAGWLPRTATTGVYLLIVWLLVQATRWALRAASRRQDAVE